MAVRRISNTEVALTLPLTDDDVGQLRAGDHVLMTGTIYAARDAAHKRLIGALDKGEPLPFDIRGQVIYYVGPTPPRPGRVIGSAGPTTSMRIDPYTPRLLEAGLKGCIGKGGRGAAVREANAVGNLVYDAQIVAVCRESGVTTLLTEDRDFRRFADLDLRHLE